jgi:hypothetical protein
MQRAVHTHGAHIQDLSGLSEASTLQKGQKNFKPTKRHFLVNALVHALQLRNGLIRPLCGNAVATNGQA